MPALGKWPRGYLCREVDPLSFGPAAVVAGARDATFPGQSGSFSGTSGSGEFDRLALDLLCRTGGLRAHSMVVMVDPSPVQGGPRTHRWWIPVAVLAVTLVALVWGMAAGLRAFFVVAPQERTAALNAEISTEVSAAREAALPSADTAHVEWLKRVSAVLGLRTGAVYSARYDICWVDHNDGGWFPESFNKKCSVAYVDFYQLPAKNDAVNRAIKDAKSSKMVPHSSGSVYVPDYLGNAGRENVDPSNLPDTIWATLPGTSDARSATDEWMITPSIVAYAAHDGFLGRTLLQEQGTTTLDPTKQYLVVPDAHPYYTKVLGCAAGVPVLCASPLGG